MKLWGTQREGWSIKGVVCRWACWDRKGEKPDEYVEGEFERLFAEQPRIILRYSGGLTPVDLAMLPLIVERLEAEHPGSKPNIRSVQDDAGGASVTITVEDLEGRTAGAFKVEVETLRADFATVQQQLLNAEEVKRALEAEYRGYQAAADAMLGRLLNRAALPQQPVYFITGPTVIEGTVMSKGNTYHTTAGQVGAVGAGAHVHDNTFQHVQDGFDLPRLAEELGRLRVALRQEAKDDLEDDEAIGAVAAAEKAAKQGDGAGALCTSRRPAPGGSGSRRRSACLWLSRSSSACCHSQAAGSLSLGLVLVDRDRDPGRDQRSPMTSSCRTSALSCGKYTSQRSCQ